MKKTASEKSNNGSKYGSIIFLIILLIIQGNIINSYLEKDISESELILFSGKIHSIKEKEIGGGRKHSVTFIKLENSEHVFKISNTSYDLLTSSDFKRYFNVGETVELGTTKTELNKTRNSEAWNNLLNQIQETRINPETYFAKFENNQFINLAIFNQLERERKNRNLLFGTPFILLGIILMGLFIYANRKSK